MPVPLYSFMSNEESSEKATEMLEQLNTAHNQLREELHKNIVGQERVLDQILISIFSGGHSLLVGVPGLAKTLMVRTLAQCLSLDFNRIQFTPDLMPSDITGTEIIQPGESAGERKLQFQPGPIFANIILADEINRTPPKTQAALLEAMEENQVTAGGEEYSLDPPFFVLATQNPIEQEGTYPLPEAQLDRFMFMIKIEYPTREEERKVMKLTTKSFDEDVEAVLDKNQILNAQKLIRKIPIADHVLNYATELIRKTRPNMEDAPQFVREWVSWGAGPRATQFLIIAGKARAALNGQPYVSTSDLQEVAHPVLRHRIITNFSAEAEGIDADQITDKLLQSVSTPSKSSKADISEQQQLSEVLGSSRT